MLNVVISLSRLVKITPFSHMYHTFVILLKLSEMGLSTLCISKFYMVFQQGDLLPVAI